MGCNPKKGPEMQIHAISGVLSYLLYCGAVRIGIYGYGSYGRRYALPIMPIILVSIFVVAYYIISNIQKSIAAVNPKLSYICLIILIVPLTLNNFNNWRTIKKNWSKEDVRSALTMWLEKTDGKDEMYLYYAAVPVFSFYAENSGIDYGKEILGIWGPFGEGIDPIVTQYKNFHYGEQMRGKDVEYVKTSISQSFSNHMPDSFWFILSHIRPDNQIYMDALAEMGYGYKVYRWGDARLLWLYNSSYIDENYKRLIKENVSLENLVVETDQLIYSAENNLYYVDGNDPKFFIAAPDITPTPNQKHEAVIDFTSTHAGSIQIFFATEDSSDFKGDNSVKAQYVVGNNKVMVELPENAKLDSLRLDFDNTGVKEGQENSIRLLRFNILEEIT